MTRDIALYDIAHCRAGDKGDDSILALVPYLADDFVRLRAVITEDAIGRHFSVQEPAQVSIVELPTLSAIVITVRGTLQGGVTRSSGSDPHGKTLSSHLLSMNVKWPVRALGECESRTADSTGRGSCVPEGGSNPSD